MAGYNETSPYQSLYQHATIEQPCSDDIDGRTSRQSPLSPGVPIINSFGSEFRLMCPICFRDLKQPRQLKPCFHIFCAECLKPIIDKSTDSKIACPKCQENSPIEDISKAVSSETYLHAFPGHISVYTESGNVSCSTEHDEAAPAEYFCLECGTNFCDYCHTIHTQGEDTHNHHSLKMFKTTAVMTVSMHRRQKNEGDTWSKAYKCPICRNTDTCVHERWIKDLLSGEFREKDECPIPEHADGNKLIAYCTVCDEPICRNCSMIEHREHKTLNIGNAEKEKRPLLNSLKKNLVFRQEIFHDARVSADRAESSFQHHIYSVEQEMIERKGAVQTMVEEAFTAAFNRVELTGRKQVELLKQSQEMHEEEEFLNVAIKLAEDGLSESVSSLDVVRIWKGLNLIYDDLHGDLKKVGSHPDEVLPQEVVEKRLVLPAPSCMNPDLRILQRVGVEGTVLRRSFKLKAEAELFLFYSILPLTETEALVACKSGACATDVVQYSNISPERYTVRLKEEGQYSIIAVPGNGIVATLYQAPNSCTGDGKGRKQILFWDQALDTSMTDLEAQGAGDNLKVLTETTLPPRAVAVTKDNHLVVCTAKDPPRSDEEGQCSILLMTMRGDILCKEDLKPSGVGPSSGPYFPRYITVNINGDVCVTDEKDQSVIILDDQLRIKISRIINPYENEDWNRRFCPRGICHDSFGRVIVADPNNDAVLRYEYSSNLMVPKPEIILKDRRDGVTDLTNPTLVALGPGPKLWVACRDNIQAFDYMDQE